MVSGARSGYIQMRQPQAAPQAQQSNIAVQRPATNFNHAHAGVVGGVTVILVWVFLFFAIVALAKYIFAGKGYCFKKTTTTGTIPNTAATTTEESLK